MNCVAEWDAVVEVSGAIRVLCTCCGRPPTDAERLAAEVVREFRVEQDEDSIHDHAQYLPPWRDRLPNGRLGPWRGPSSDARLARALRAYQERAGGEALWDREEEEFMHPRRRQQREALAAAVRYDAEPMRRFVERRSHELPMTELEVYERFWVEGRSYGQIAREVGRQRKTVANLVASLRGRLKECSGKPQYR